MLSEMRRGASGFMPAAEAIDVHVQIWDAYQAGDERRARDIFNLLLPQINLIMAVGLNVCKEILVRRGVIESARLRGEGGCLMVVGGGQAAKIAGHFLAEPEPQVGFFGPNAEFFAEKEAQERDWLARG